MKHAEQAAWVFAGDAPGVWWVIHARAPRFAARLLSAEEFAADPRLASRVPHGLNVPVPVHFNLGADVLVVTDFLDPVQLDESVSPQQAILTGAMIEALHACQAAISRVAAQDREFAPLAHHAEQFLVGWKVARTAAGGHDLSHASGAWVHASVAASGECEATLRLPPREDRRFGWEPDLLRDRLERVAGERAQMIDAGWETLPAEGGSVLSADTFAVLARQDRRRLSWVKATRPVASRDEPLDYAALRISGPVALTCPTAIELDARCGLHLGARPFTAEDAESILALMPAYGLSIAVNLRAAFHFAWYDDSGDEGGDRHRAPPLPGYPCEVEVVTGGNLVPAVVFAPANPRGRFRLIVAPHAPGVPGGDTAAVMPYDCLSLRRQQFHLPRYLLEATPVS